jgi:hypothetical protein
LGLSFLNGTTPATGSPDSINRKGAKVTSSPVSGLSTYWPRIVGQDPSGVLFEYVFGSQFVGRSLNVSAQPGGGVVALPLMPEYTKSSAAGGYGVLYQGSGGRLSLNVPDNSSSTWTNGK